VTVKDLLQEAEDRWGRVFGPLTFVLTSRPDRGTAHFYEQLGFRAVGETVRYMK